MFGLFFCKSGKWQRLPKKDAVTVPSKDTRKLTVRVPVFQLDAMRKECKKQGISINEATVMLYSWILNKRLEFQIIKKVKEARE